MNRLDVTLDTTTVTIALDDSAPLVDRFWGVVGVRLVDELTGQPPRSAIVLKTTHSHLWPRVAEDGLIGLVGIPRQVFPALDTSDYTVDMIIAARGYIGQQLTVTIPANPAFPTAFMPLILPDLDLHRLPIVIKGRTVLANGGDNAPLSGVTVQITGVWRTSPPANIIVPADPPNLVYLTPPVYAGRVAGPGRLRRRNLIPIPGDDKLLLDPQPAGSNTLHLTNRLNLSTGDILFIDAGLPERSEYLPIQAVRGGSTPDQETRITLEHPTAYEHRQGSLIQRVTVQPLGPSNQLTAAAICGDATVFLNGLNGLTSAHPARLSGGSAVEEYHDVWQYIATSNSKDTIACRR